MWLFLIQFSSKFETKG